MKSISILLFLSATLTSASPTLSSQDVHTYLYRRQHNPGPIPFQRSNPYPSLPNNIGTQSQTQLPPQPNTLQRRSPSSKSPDPSPQQRPPSTRALTRSNQFNKLKYAASSDNRHAMLTGVLAGGASLMNAGAAMGAGPSSAIMAAGNGISSMGMMGMAAHQAWEHARDASKTAKGKKST